MSKRTINLVARGYDLLMPLACGDVDVEGVELNLDRKTDMKAFMADPFFDAGEMSFSQYLIRTAQDEREFVGLPVFLMRGFRHRCFFVLRDSGLNSFQSLVGKRVGTNGWPDTGNTWSRAALREQGVGLDQIDWWVGPVDDPAYDSFGQRPALTLPPNVQPLAAGQTLQDMLLAGDLEAMMCPWPPRRSHEPNSPIVRLFPNFREVEQAYARRVGFYPGFHILAVRRGVLERDPWVAHSLYQAFEQARKKAQADRRWLADTSPWLLADFEEAAALFGSDWQPNGVEANLTMIQALCDEEYAQGLISKPLDSTTVFAEFEKLMEEETYA